MDWAKLKAADNTCDHAPHALAHVAPAPNQPTASPPTIEGGTLIEIEH